jgi:hypothetical protein
LKNQNVNIKMTVQKLKRILSPFQGLLFFCHSLRALPWANISCPFGAKNWIPAACPRAGGDGKDRASADACLILYVIFDIETL